MLKMLGGDESPKMSLLTGFSETQPLLQLIGDLVKTADKDGGGGKSLSDNLSSLQQYSNYRAGKSYNRPVISFSDMREVASSKPKEIIIFLKLSALVFSRRKKTVQLSSILSP